MPTAPRIVLFTVDDLEFVPDLLGPVVDTWRPSIIKCFVSRSLFDFKYFGKNGVRLIRYGYPFCIRSADVLRFATMKLWSGQAYQRGAANMVEFLRKKGVDADYVDDIDSEQTLSALRELQADIFLFGAFDKIAKGPFLSIPRIGCFNTHMGKLPEHKGGLSAFWVLRFGDDEAGVTVHRAIEQVDRGEIVSETRFPVTTHSMFELMHATFRAGAETVDDALRKIASDTWQPISVEGRKSGYYRIPKAADFKEFYSRGCRLI